LEVLVLNCINYELLINVSTREDHVFIHIYCKTTPWKSEILLLLAENPLKQITTEILLTMMKSELFPNTLVKCGIYRMTNAMPDHKFHTNNDKQNERFY
jgi:hypothetical protein